MKKAVLVFVLLFILVLGMAVSACSSEAEPVAVPQIDTPAPDFQLQSLDGETISLSGLQGRPVMLNFWATWCGPCRLEMPYIQGVFEDSEWTEQGLVILAVNVGESSSDVREFIESNGLSFQILLDTDTKVAQSYNVSGIPATFFIDKNGIIKDIHIGAFTSKENVDWRLINSILEGE